MIVTRPALSGSIGPAISYNPPSDNATLWLRADGSSFTGFSDNTPIGEVGVTPWNNEGTASGVFVDPGAGANDRPKYRASGPNSKPYIQGLNNNNTDGFLVGQTGGGSNITGSNYISSTAYHTFMVYMISTGGTIPSGTPSDTTSADFYMDTGYFSLPVSNQKFGIFHYSGQYVEYASTFSLDTWYVVERYFSSNTASIKVNGGTATTAGSFGNVNAGGIAAGDVAILARHNSGLNLRANLAEMITFQTQLSAGLATTYRTALGAKYGITIT